MANQGEGGQAKAQGESAAARATRWVVQTAGVGCIAGGAWMVSPAAGLIVLGAVIVGLSVLRWALAR